MGKVPAVGSSTASLSPALAAASSVGNGRSSSNGSSCSSSSSSAGTATAAARASAKRTAPLGPGVAGMPARGAARVRRMWYSQQSRSGEPMHEDSLHSCLRAVRLSSQFCVAQRRRGWLSRRSPA